MTWLMILCVEMVFFRSKSVWVISPDVFTVEIYGCRGSDSVEDRLG